MRNIRVFLPLVAAVLLLSALTAFSGSGPYGNYGPSDNTVMAQGDETRHDAVAGGSGPYGAFGPIYKDVGTPRTDLASGTGPYGTFNSYGMVVGSESNQIANKDDCLKVAMNCPTDTAK